MRQQITSLMFVGLMLTMVLLLSGCDLLSDQSIADIFKPSSTPTTTSPVVTSQPVVPKNYAAIVSSPSLWTQLNPVGTAPTPRKQHASVYDAANDRLIIFGGTGGDQYFNDTWVLTNASGITGTPSWMVLTTSGTTPPKRWNMVAARNSAKNILIILGGADEKNSIQMDLWVLTNANGLGNTAPTWEQLTIAGTPPTGRARMAGVYDEANDVLILFGGGTWRDQVGTFYDETWTITSVTTNPTWQKLVTAGTPPASRIGHSAVYDAAGNRMIIFGGNTSRTSPPEPSGRINDTWVLSNANGTGGTPVWSPLHTIDRPPAREGHSAVFDSKNKRIIIFGGSGVDRVVRKDVWILTDMSGATPTWAEYDTGSVRPQARIYHRAIYTGSTTNRMVIFAGDTGNNNLVNDVWVLRGASGVPSTPVKTITIKGASNYVSTSYILHLGAVAYDEANDEVEGVLSIWSSSDPSVATVASNGLVKGIGPGTATVTVTHGNITSRFVVTVSGGPPETTPPVVSPPTTPTSPAPQAKPVIPLTIDTRWGNFPAYIIVETDGAVKYQVDPETLMAYGGSPLARYTWGKPTGGRFPPSGITVDVNGVVRGTGGALAEGTHTFDVEVSDGSRTATATFAITVKKYVKQSGPIPDPGPPIAVFQQPAPRLVDGRAGQYYAASLHVVGGKPPYSWFVDPTYQSDFVLSGLTIDMSGGIVRGTISPTMSGQTIKFGVIVRDSTGETAEYGPIYTINVR